MNTCNLCGKKLFPVLNLGKHPLCDDLIKPSENRTNREYLIEIIFCRNCIIAYQKYIVPKKILFPKNYHYRSKMTEDVINGQKLLVEDVKKYLKEIKNLKVLDIGCNDGTLLDLFKIEKCKTIGVEPTNAYIEASRRHKIYNDYFEKKLAIKIKKKYKEIDIITFTNVFAHINDLNDLIESLKILISNKTIIVIENHYLESILRSNQFDTFYHEHPRTYSLKSLKIIADRLNLNIVNVKYPKRYGGNIRVILSSSQSKINFFNTFKREEKLYLKFLMLNKKIKKWKKNKIKLFTKLNKKYGPLPAKAFPGRAAIILKLLNLSNKNISAIFEKPKSKKIGFYAPGTNIQIVNDQKLIDINKKIPIINLAWHIKKEIKKYIKSKSLKNKIINIIEKKDFN